LRQNEITWLSIDRVKMKFHSTKESDISNYEKYILSGIGIETPFDFKVGLKEGILGDEEFLDKALAVSMPTQRRKIELFEIASKVCEQLNISETDLRAPGKLPEHSQARAMLVLLAKKENLSIENVGAYLGRDPSGLAKLATRLESKSACEPKIAIKIQAIYDFLSDVITS
jgi:hypothetical protein